MNRISGKKNVFARIFLEFNVSIIVNIGLKQPIKHFDGNVNNIKLAAVNIEYFFRGTVFFVKLRIRNFITWKKIVSLKNKILKLSLSRLQFSVVGACRRER